jgi:dTMP kinase
VYSIALVPDLVMYLRVAPQKLMERYIYRGRELDYWESGMDIGYSRSWYDSFIRYQSELHRTFNKLQNIYGFATINGMRVPRAITRDLQTRIEAVLSPDG